MTHACVHFVGFRGDEFCRAQKVWGYPDFIHKWHDHRMYGDIDIENDIIIFANMAKAEVISDRSWQDHELW
jgi:hypothetical protein